MAEPAAPCRTASAHARRAYAEQGIPFFWRVDEGPRVQSFRLDPRTGVYRCEVELGPGEAGELAAPWPVHFDTNDLVMPHKRR